MIAKEATIFLLVVIATSAELVQRWDHLVLPSDVTICGMLTSLTWELSKSTTKKTTKYLFEDNNAPIQVCSSFSWATIEMGPPGYTIRCEYWWNADHSSIPFSWQKTNGYWKQGKHSHFTSGIIYHKEQPPKCGWGRQWWPLYYMERVGPFKKVVCYA